MFMLIHTLIGGLIGDYFHSVLFIILLSIASHFFIDMIPHWDGGDFDKGLFHKTGMVFVGKLSTIVHVVDLIVCIFLMTFLYKEFHSKLMLIGAIAAIVPDIAKWGYATKLKRNRHFMNYLKFHAKIQKDANWKLGLFIQIAILILLIVMLF
ncbi:MAG: hypothetical protein PHF67_00325 [Candidatus Nanoarchaeia archaeon]|nr:hypothetical protein [Candidatus Nanoarchaeia archaeon]